MVKSELIEPKTEVSEDKGAPIEPKEEMVETKEEPIEPLEPKAEVEPLEPKAEVDDLRAALPVQPDIPDPPVDAVESLVTMPSLMHT